MAERARDPAARSADARVAALLATLPSDALDALAASMARLLVSAAAHRGPPRRRVPFAAARRRDGSQSRPPVAPRSPRRG